MICPPALPARRRPGRPHRHVMVGHRYLPSSRSKSPIAGVFYSSLLLGLGDAMGTVLLAGCDEACGAQVTQVVMESSQECGV